MTNAIAFRGEQSAMSSKHTGVAPTAFDDYIKSVTVQEPTFTVEITPEYLEAHADIDKLAEIFGENLVHQMTDRLRSGERRSDEEINEAHRRINEIVLKRMLANRDDERFVWFTFRRDGRYNYLDWPVATYMGLDRFTCWHEESVTKALTRLVKNRTITDIRVAARKPKHWYFKAL